LDELGDAAAKVPHFPERKGLFDDVLLDGGGSGVSDSDEDDEALRGELCYRG
jgi:hypothetical protein